jgi:hypothetical protein
VATLQGSHHLLQFFSAESLVMLHDYFQHLVSLGFFCSLCVTLCSVSITLFLSVEPSFFAVDITLDNTKSCVDVDSVFVRA